MAVCHKYISPLCESEGDLPVPEGYVQFCTFLFIHVLMNRKTKEETEYVEAKHFQTTLCFQIITKFSNLRKPYKAAQYSFHLIGVL